MALRTKTKHRPVIAVLFSTALILVACGSGPSSSKSGQTTPAAPPMATPLIGSVIAPPVAVPSTDGRTHLAYELTLTNTQAGNATLNSLTASAGDARLLTLSGDNLKYWTRILGNSTAPANVIGPGQTAIVWLDVVVDNGKAPADITHSVRVNVSKPIPGLIPADVTQDIAPVTVSDRKPVSIAPRSKGGTGSTPTVAAIPHRTGWPPTRSTESSGYQNDSPSITSN